MFQSQVTELAQKIVTGIETWDWKGLPGMAGCSEFSGHSPIADTCFVPS